jgi:hypothetical protein
LYDIIGAERHNPPRRLPNPRRALPTIPTATGMDLPPSVNTSTGQHSSSNGFVDDGTRSRPRNTSVDRTLPLCGLATDSRLFAYSGSG